MDELGIGKKLSARSQTFAKIDEANWEKFLARWRERAADAERVSVDLSGIIESDDEMPASGRPASRSRPRKRSKRSGALMPEIDQVRKLMTRLEERIDRLSRLADTDEREEAIEALGALVDQTQRVIASIRSTDAAADIVDAADAEKP